MISKRGEQKYLVQVDAGRDATGKRLRVSEVVNGTKRQAQAREADVRKQKNDEDNYPRRPSTENLQMARDLLRALIRASAT